MKTENFFSSLKEYTVQYNLTRVRQSQQENSDSKWTMMNEFWFNRIWILMYCPARWIRLKVVLFERS